MFPAQADTLHLLKIESEPFRAVARRYHDLTQEIGRLENGLEAGSDARLEELKKERLGVLDEIAEMIAERQAA